MTDDRSPPDSRRPKKAGGPDASEQFAPLQPSSWKGAAGRVKPAIHGRVFKNVEEVRSAVIAFKDRYSRDWRLEKLGFMSPREARQAYAMRKAA